MPEPILTAAQANDVVAGLSAEVKRRRKLARAATPGPWERGPRRESPIIVAPLPDNERGSWHDGVVPEDLALPYAGQRERIVVLDVPTWSSHKFMRDRSGKDLDHVAAAADPTHVLAQLDDVELRMAEDLLVIRDWSGPVAAGGPAAVARLLRSASDSLRRLAAVYGVAVMA